MLPLLESQFRITQQDYVIMTKQLVYSINTQFRTQQDYVIMTKQLVYSINK
jgi:hypothetical protein